MDVAIIGSGHMARAIGTRLIKGGARVTFYDREEEKAQALAKELNADAKSLGEPITSDVVIAAVPYAAMDFVVVTLKDQLPGKIFVDISNPVNFQTFELLPPPDSSGAEEIAKKVPKGTKVVKAFNTVFAGTLINGTVDGKPLDVFIAGDDEKAKKVIAELVKGAGLRPLDAGPLARARGLESFMLIAMSMQGTLGTKSLSAIKILS